VGRERVAGGRRAQEDGAKEQREGKVSEFEHGG
jgi:hypothetical protein